MPIRITVTVDEGRLREAGLSTEPADIMAELAAMHEGRLSLQTRDRWVPVRDLRIRPVFSLAPDTGAE